MNEPRPNETPRIGTEIVFNQTVTDTNFREFIEMSELIDNKDGQLQVRTHVTNVENALSMIDPLNIQNGLVIYNHNIDSTSIVLRSSDPYLAFTAHKSGRAVVVIKIPRGFVDVGKEENLEFKPGVKEARKDALMENLPHITQNGSKYPKLPLETIYGVLIGGSKPSDVFMQFNSLILNPNYNPDKLMSIIQEEHPDYDPSKITKPLGRVGGMWGAQPKHP